MKMKRYLAYAFFLTLLFTNLVGGTALAGSRYMEGFRGIAWGTHKNDLPDLGLSKGSLKKIYKSGPYSVLFMEGKGNLSLELDDIPLLSIFMHFDDQVFKGVDLVFNPQNREKVHAIMTKEMGASGAPDAEGANWQAGDLVIRLTDRELLVSHRGR